MKFQVVTALILLYSWVAGAAKSDGGAQSVVKSLGMPTLGSQSLPMQDDGIEPFAVKSIRKNTMQRFCQSVKEIEQLRVYQLEQLKSSFQVDRMPTDISSFSDPTLKPFLNPKVRAVVEAFPFQSEAILKKHRIDTDEFNRMLDKTKRNASFRRKVEKEMKRSSKQDEHVL